MQMPATWKGSGRRDTRRARLRPQKRKPRGRCPFTCVVFYSLMPAACRPADYDKLIADENEKWGKVIRAANVKPQ
jgi:hypothetical protein